MTDQVNALTVVLECDISQERATELALIINMLKGVSLVTPNVASPVDHIAQRRAHRELSDKLWAVLYPE
jgi:hypothetical protein